jgi:hypothetical protein
MKRIFFATAALAALVALSCATAPAAAKPAKAGAGARQAVLATPAVALPAEYIVSTGKAYSLNFEPKADFPDKGGLMLTDGKSGPQAEGLVAFLNPSLKEYSTVVIDLGEYREDLSFFGVRALYSAAAKALPPDAIIVSVSEDDELYEMAGGSVRAIGDYKEGGEVLIGLVPAEPLAGQYVKIAVLCDDPEARTLVSELLVGAGAAPAGLEPVAAKAFEAYDNVALGKGYTLKPSPEGGYPDASGKEATDGQAAYKWGDMMGFQALKMMPTIVIDLGADQRVDAVRCSFMRSQASAVTAPTYFTVSVADAASPGSFRLVGVATVYDPPVMDEKINTLIWRNDTGKDILASKVRVAIAPKGSAWTMFAEAEVLAGR